MYIHLFGMIPPSVPVLPCMCASIRRASRALSQHYEETLRPLGLRTTQFTVLQSLSLAGEMTQGFLGQMLAMDSTSLTRTLRIMGRHGWIRKRRGEDRREWRIQLTKTGETQLKRALPAWQKVQTQLHNQVGEEVWESLLKLTSKVTDAVIE